MTAAIGRTLILASLLAASAGTVLSFAAARTRSAAGLSWSRRLAYFYAAAVVLANVMMIYALITHDFSVSYVAQVGSRSVPLWVTVVSLWSSLEGSILFWGMVLGIYIALAQRDIDRSNPESFPYATGVWLACGTFFSFLLAGPAQPFASVPNPPLDGPGPNPLLQNHVLMAVHPPFLYLGYVGMTIPFGLASAALLQGRLGAAAIRSLRRWLLLPWTFLTIAIVLGGWWAYEVLGWGGYWAWDPVENASLLPWLTATAALHSAILMERKRVLKGWTMTLVLATFLLTILGTFMTRSGVFNSVHSFTQSAIGPTILVFLAITLIWSLVILSMRIDKLAPERELGTLASREGMFLVNNLLFVLFTLTVLIGTVFPLVVEAAAGRQISVGRPYFDKMTIPIGLAILLLMGVGPALPWGRASRRELARTLLPPLTGAAILTILGILAGIRGAVALVTFALGGYAAWVTLAAIARSRTSRLLGTFVIHAAVIVTILSISAHETMHSFGEMELARGQSGTLGAFTFTFLGARELREPHRDAVVAEIEVRRDGRFVGTMMPRMNFYARQREPIGTPAIRSTAAGDLYLSVVSIDSANQKLVLSARYNPMVPWIWIATGVLAIAAFLIAFRDRRLPALPRIRLAPAARHAAMLMLLGTTLFAQTDLDQKTAEVASLLRCPVCQGLSVNDSPSAMATNMKAQVRELLSKGYTTEQVLKHFETSYGEFVLLDPPRRGLNWLLWTFPAILLLGGGFFVYRITARKPAVAAPSSALPHDPVLAKYVQKVRALECGGLPPPFDP